nr:MAG TPA: hypothetical protein [Caudoviricetes sp.]
MEVFFVRFFLPNARKGAFFLWECSIFPSSMIFIYKENKEK